MTESLIQHVSDTAYMVAHHRAVESARSDAAFRDPLAARLAGDHGREIVARMRSSALTAWTVTLRTTIIDAYLAEAIARGVDTIVNLGAGLDTRPYRLELPKALRWIEVDNPKVIAFKEEKLAGEVPRCRLERVGLDLADLPARKAFLSRLEGRVLVLTEGVVPYLDVDAVGALADDLRATGRVEGWIVDSVSPEATAYRRRSRIAKDMRQAPFRFEPPDWSAFFAGHGWKARETRYLGDEGKRLGRAPPLPFALKVVMKVLGLFAPASRRDGFRKSMAYVLLVPE